jgi:hypothetical protein
MNNLPTEYHQSFIEKFHELFTLYREVKEIVFLAEYENKEQKYIISSVNELRNTLDHIMRSFDSPESLEKNFDKAKGHLYRAGYDGYEIVVISKLNEIKTIKEQFKFEAITTAYPDYFTKVIPIVSKAKKQLVSARANKKIDNGFDIQTEEKHFFQFETIATELIQIVDDINLHIEGIVETQKEIKKRFWRNSIFSVLVIGIILLLIEYLFFVPKNKVQEEKSNPKTEQFNP